MIQLLRNPKVLQFIQENLHEHSADLILGAHKYPDLPIKAIATQIEARQRIKNKLPEWYANDQLIFPRKENLEQASSEATAKYKAQMIKGSFALDLTGGSGVDAYAFSKSFAHIEYVEPNEELCDLATYNFSVLDANIEVHQKTAEAFLDSNSKKYDLVYLDPSRRSDSNQRLVALDEYLPNVVELQKALFNISDRVLVKASPMLDIHQAVEQLQHVTKVVCLSVDNEMKEVLFLTDIHATTKEPEIVCENIGNPKRAAFKFNRSEEDQATVSFSEPQEYVYDPFTAIRKSGAFNLFGERYQLLKLAPNTHLYTSSELNKDIPARVFKVLGELKGGAKSIRKSARNGLINVISKNYPLSATEIKKKYKLQDGGEQFLILCTSNERKLVLLCELI